MANAHSSGNLLTTQRALLDTLTSFLTVCTHHILFLRNLYPARSFLATRAYNYPVRQNRHPAVCSWINDAIAAIRSQLSKSTVDKVQLCIYETEHNRVLERWTFDIHALAAVSPRDQDMPFDEDDNPDLDTRPVNVTDLEAVFRATLSRITAAAALGRLDKHERAWIVAEPDSFSQTSPLPSSSNKIDPAIGVRRQQEDGGGAKTTPVRRLEAGELRMEVWVEESAAKSAYITNTTTLPAHSHGAGGAQEMNYGAGMTGYGARFDLENGYEDVHGTDINRKPDTGRGAM
ncbi:hypothetical protein DV738_g4884, partial [Chaetothyriales sp. CBS 135597]